MSKIKYLPAPKEGRESGLHGGQFPNNPAIVVVDPWSADQSRFNAFAVQ